MYTFLKLDLKRISSLEITYTKLTDYIIKHKIKRHGGRLKIKIFSIKIIAANKKHALSCKAEDSFECNGPWLRS